MDNLADSSVDAGTSGLQSDVANDGAKSPGASDGVEGRIDPAIARATAGADFAAAFADPPGDGNSGADNRPASPPAEGESGPRKRGRPRGPATAAGTQERSETPRNIRASFVEKSLMGIHLALAALSKCPEFELQKDDAKALGEATANVLAFYKVRMTPKQEAYGLLIEAAAQVYPPMFASIYFRKMAEAKEKARNNPTPIRTDAPRPVAPVAPSAPTGFDPGKIILPPG